MFRNFGFRHDLVNVGVIDGKMIQPNAIDVRASELFDINKSTFVLDDEKTYHRGTNDLFAETGTSLKRQYGEEVAVQDDKMYFRLEANGSYQFLTGLVVHIPEGHCGWLISRSSLIRNGLIVISGLFDSGYTGPIGAVIHNRVNAPAYIEWNARIGQFLFAEAETGQMYAGQYNLKHQGFGGR